MEPFTENDLSFRLIPDHEETRLIHFISGHYDTSKAAADPNILFPLDRIHDLVASGEVGKTAEYHISMGLTTELRKLKEEVSWKIAEAVIQTRPDVVVLTGG
jgi:D-proline reductase (dithiol) PrdB